ncbi:DUF4378 domain-containing protein [Quillaja saponaria]|uniref:DUF4378 domain-containing protein n=1 Tax=Quillaja saponaria TaxID=32244 RepID=A0AAD7VFQ6_QUISA|nr:DUF4378 domain-containing protein [Quillaja saponaria]
MYRSFVTCDDPNGVVDCGTIRKCKTDSQKMEQKMKSRRAVKKADTSLTNKSEKEEMIPKGFKDDSCDPSSLQLMEVSRGAQKLNQVIDSWFKGINYEGQSEDVAKDLLKGALDLQESLVMLHKFQEASQYMTRLRKEQNSKPERGRFDELMNERTYPNQVRDQNYPMGFQNPRLSADGSSRNSVEELKKVVRDSLVRQNLLTSTTSEEMISASEIPSTSSSQSSVVHADRLTDSSLSSTSLQDKKKGPNLIAKLLGLEEVQPKPSQATLQKQVQGEKILNQQRPMFDVDKPQVRKSPFLVQRVNPEHKTLKEILWAMHFKGLLKNNSAKEPKPQFHHSYSKQRLINDAPPIVLIKPICTPYLGNDDPHAPVLLEEKALKTKFVVRKLKKDEVPHRRINQEEGSMNSSKMYKKLEAEEAQSKRCQVEGPKDLKEIGKTDEKEVKPNDKSLDKGKMSGRVSQKPRKSERIEKKSKLNTTSRKPLDKEIMKAGNSSRSKDQGTSTKLRKHESGSITKKNEAPRQQRTAPSAISKSTPQKIKDCRKYQIKKQRPVGELTAAKLVAKNLGQQEDVERIDLPCEDDSKLIRTPTRVTTLADQLSMDNDIDITSINDGDHCEIDQSPLEDVTLLNSKDEKDATTFAEEANDNISWSTVDHKGVKDRSDLKYLLLSSHSFITHAKELFNLDEDCYIIPQTSETHNFVIANLRLYSDCANELIERKSLHDSQKVHPLLVTCMRNLRLCISLDNLVEEICNSIQNLESYSKTSPENLSVDSLYAFMDRDIMCKGLVQGIWDFGWRHAFSAHEAEQVVNDIVKQVVSGLIEEVIRNP